ncbi:Tetratricopeptide-like helical [Penicillium fimorum]|uniref:Tetratricopeptide-like helical n=1 Tax=Penicillium fimorum TaxID=1882269 RepID=A0A9W9XSG5_9EURO|nr:Tetratricopeptide-like helical [Penicillium fimorum]
MLAQRLGKANTKRHQLLAYHKDHIEKISRYVDEPQVSRRNGHRITTPSTLYNQDNDVGSDSGQTKFSATTSTAGDQAHVLMPPPSPPANVMGTVQNQPSFCPYCRQMVQLEDVDEAWKYHVYSDLRPYICTSGDCVKEHP